MFDIYGFDIFTRAEDEKKNLLSAVSPLDALIPAENEDHGNYHTTGELTNLLVVCTV